MWPLRVAIISILIYEITLTPFEVFYYNIMVNINMNYSNKCTINMYSLYR